MFKLNQLESGVICDFSEATFDQMEWTINKSVMKCVMQLAILLSQILLLSEVLRMYAY